MSHRTNKEDVFELIQKHPEGLDDDDISAITALHLANKCSSCATV